MSSEEPFNYIEHKIKEAAENNEIVFEESSWKKMELLLDKEPRRKPFVWWWFMLPLSLAGAFGVYLLNNKPHENIDYRASQSEKISPTNTSTPALYVAIKNNDQQNKNDVNPINNKASLTAANNYKTEKLQLSKKRNKNILSTSLSQNSKENSTIKEENINSIENVINEKGTVNFSTNNGSVSYVEVDVKNIVAIIKDSVKIEILTTTKTDSSSGKNEKKADKKKQRLLGKFYLLGSAGADVSSTKLLAFKNNPPSFKYGGVIGFNVSKKLSVQTGIFAGKKKYLAKEGEYNFKTGSYYNTVKIIKVDAECIVYEIPVSVRYNMIQKKTINVYSGIGLSSYIMKKEDYVVHFMRYNMPYSREWYYTGNQHLFSTLIIMAGAEKKITNQLFLQIEPSVGIPLKGVGEGNVKLFSAGLQMGLKYYPFK